MARAIILVPAEPTEKILGRKSDPLERIKISDALRTNSGKDLEGVIGSLEYKIPELKELYAAGELQLTALRDDCQRNGYAIAGIETEIMRLRKKDTTVRFRTVKKGGAHEAWGAISSRLEPLTLENKNIGKGHLRASEAWGCDLGRIYAKIDLNYFKQYGIILDTRTANFGTIRHTLSLGQHVKDFIHARRACFPDRIKYCERPVKHTTPNGVEVIGNLDCSVELANNGIVGNIDLKRRERKYYKPLQFEMQGMTYAKAQDETFGFGAKLLLAITLGRTFKALPNEENLTVPQITMTENLPDSPLLQMIDNEWEASYAQQAKLLEDRSYLLNFKTSKENSSKGGCTYFNAKTGKTEICSKKPVCDFLVNKAREDGASLRDILDDLKVILPKYDLPNSSINLNIVEKRHIYTGGLYVLG